jgi:hypothetical protein
LLLSKYNMRKHVRTLLKLMTDRNLSCGVACSVNILQLEMMPQFGTTHRQQERLLDRLTNDPKFEGLNPATATKSKDNAIEKKCLFFKLFWLMLIAH